MASHLNDSAEDVRTLISWKEIASFLNRAERTVKRWERERGLPVHRVPGGERGRVFAYPGELADWLKGKVHELEADDLATSDQETSGSAETGVANQGKVDPRPGEAASRSGRQEYAHRVTFAVIGIAAALAGVGIYASFARPYGNWIQRRLPAIAGDGQSSSVRQVVTPVSDAEKSVAHDLYLKGRFEWNQRTPDSLNRALDDFTQAIVHNPNDARAYAGLADTYEMLFIYGSRQDVDARDRAMAAARKAVEIDGALAEAHRALGYAAWRSKNFNEAEKELHLAIQLDPKDPLAHLWLSNVLASQGKDGECLAEINRAQEIDPASASILAMKGERLFFTGKKDEGIALLKASIRSEPTLSIAHLYLAEIEFRGRNYPAYLRESQAAADSRNDAWLKKVTAKLSAAYARDGERGLLNAEFAVQESCSPPRYSWEAPTRSQRAIECLSRDRKPEALQLLEEANANHEKEFDDLRAAFASGSPQGLYGITSKLAGDPRFQALMQEKTDLPRTAKLPTFPDSGAQ
jgi:tetratricopeptide (TPR) repeat protein/phage terminase Nu1 subunit (DNA packaging protein)